MNVLSSAVLTRLGSYVIPGPEPIPGMEKPINQFLSYMIYGGLILAVVSVVTALVVVCGTQFFGWHISKKVLGRGGIAVLCAGALGSISTVVGLLIPGV